MLYQVIERKKAAWLAQEDCPVRPLLAHMRERDRLRGTQIEAIETYLFLKTEGRNKPLWKLFSEGFFSTGIDLASLHVKQTTREYMEEHPAAYAIYDFAREKVNGSPRLPELEKMILDSPEKVEYDRIIQRMFYGVNYADYLMSLPMGAGKTYLMAAFIYLDLYFAQNEPDNRAFAHNFLVLIPSGLKSSIAPSLRTIEGFDPSWLIPEPAASDLKRLLKFEVLDEAKSAKKSNKARNPNAQKVSASLADPFGNVFVVNAEKVILDRVELNDQLDLMERTEDEQDRFANELRNLIGKLPHLSLMIDEVHHAATDDIKLRQVVNRWQKGGNITTVLGFSGTPYLPKVERIPVTDKAEFKFTQISNTVYYYPLVNAIKDFLKKPTVREGRNLDRFEVIRQGVNEFKERYGKTVYGTGAIAKLAIYCSNIQVLEEEVYPFLTGELGIPTDEVLKFHKGNKEFPEPEGSELAFRSLDMPHSNKRYVLLVQVGKEGWDCPSLTGVILSQQGDSPKNMVLQTACRCLRQVDRGAEETALIWLNTYNAKTLNEQLKKEQQTSIEELNRLQRSGPPEMLPRHSRMEHLQLPTVEMYQMRINYLAEEVDENPDTENRLTDLLQELDRYRDNSLIESSRNFSENKEIEIIKHTGADIAQFNHWLFELHRESAGAVALDALRAFDAPLRAIFDRITTAGDGASLWNDLYDRYRINSAVRLCFHIRRRLNTESEVIPEKAQLLLAEKLTPVAQQPRLWPDLADTEKILHMDREGIAPAEPDPAEVQRAYDTMKATLEAQGMGNFVPPFSQFRVQSDHSLAVLGKELTFHYLPYDFAQSGLELTILQEVMKLSSFRQRGLEMYYNGERGLSSFVIRCYAKEGRYWKNVGRYTTDFLIIQRKEREAIHRVLMVETKGRGFANDTEFKKKREYVTSEFLRMNNEKFGYARFDFLYIEDSATPEANLIAISQRMEQFFE